MNDQVREQQASDEEMPKIGLLEDDGAEQEEFDYADGKKDVSQEEDENEQMGDDNQDDAAEAARQQQ